MTVKPEAWKPSRLVSSFEESATLALGAKAKKLVAEGRSIINFGVGEPDFNTPEGIIHAAVESAKKGNTKYTAVAGIPALRQAIAKHMTADYGLPFQEQEVLISSGGKQAIYHFLQAALEPGDEVLVISPYWVSFPEMVKLVGGVPVIVRPKSARLSAKDIQQAITPRTRALILNSPSNPSGAVLSRDEMKEILNVIEPHPIWLLSDDTYYHLVYEPAVFVSPLHVRPEFRERVCLIGSASKSYSMTGWRLGWAVAPAPMITAMTKLQSQVTSNASSLSQAAVLAAVTSFGHVPVEFKAQFVKRRNAMIEGLKEIPGLQWVDPEGAFYVFVDFTKVLKGRKVADYAEELLMKHGVCMIPGEAFGEPAYGRLSYVLSEDDIQEGIRRIKHSLGL